MTKIKTSTTRGQARLPKVQSLKNRVLGGQANRALGGQGLVEYVLITAMVALATMAVFRTFRADIKQAYQKVGTILMQGVDDQGSSSGDGDE